MKKKLQKPKIIGLCILLVLGLINRSAYAQQSAQFEQLLQSKMTDFLSGPNVENQSIKRPELGLNGAAVSASVPIGFGGSGFSFFGGIGGVYPQAYSNSADMGGSVGISLGNPVSFVNIAVSLNISDLSKFDNYSGSLSLSRHLFAGTSVTAGVMNLFPNKGLTDFAKQTYYIAFSHAVQTLPSNTPGGSKLTYGIGIGNGAFYDKSPMDMLNGKGKNGTAVFAHVSYEVFRYVNLIAEWNGLNLGIATGLKPFSIPLSLTLGVNNLTNYSSNKVGMTFGLGYPLSLSKR